MRFTLVSDEPDSMRSIYALCAVLLAGCLIFAVLVCSRTASDGQSAQADEPQYQDRFEIVSVPETPLRIIIDTDTGVQYLYVRRGTSQGGMTPLLDADGKPLLASGQPDDELKTTDIG